MKCFARIGSETVRLFSVTHERVECIGEWATISVLSSADVIQESLQHTLKSLSQSRHDRLGVIVDLPGDILRQTPAGLIGRWRISRLRRSLASRFLGQRRFQRVITGPLRWSGAAAADRYFALEDCAEFSAWMELLEQSCQPCDLPVAVYPLALLAELEVASLCQGCPFVLYCHADEGSLHRHTLLCNGRVVFTRSLMTDRSDDDAVVSLAQLQETHRHLLEAEWLQKDATLVVILPANVPQLVATSIAENFQTLRYNVIPDLPAPLEAANQCAQWQTTLASHVGWLAGLRITQRRRLKNFDVACLSVAKPLSITSRLARGCGITQPVLQKFVLSLAVTSFLLTGLSIGHGFRLHTKLDKQKKLLSELQVQLSELDYAPAVQARAVQFGDNIRQQWSEPEKLIYFLGQQLANFSTVRLLRLDWCWAALEDVCATGMQPQMRAQLDFDLAESVVAERLLFRFTGEVVAPFLSRREDYAHYAMLLQKIQQQSPARLLREDYTPHSDAATAREFSVVLEWVAVRPQRRSPA